MGPFVAADWQQTLIFMVIAAGAFFGVWLADLLFDRIHQFFCNHRYPRNGRRCHQCGKQLNKH